VGFPYSKAFHHLTISLEYVAEPISGLVSLFYHVFHPTPLDSLFIFLTTVLYVLFVLLVPISLDVLSSSCLSLIHLIKLGIERLRQATDDLLLRGLDHNVYIVL